MSTLGGSLVMHTLQHALSTLLTLFFGPHADGRELTSWGEILGWVVKVPAKAGMGSW